jgi:hypothetical protein
MYISKLIIDCNEQIAKLSAEVEKLKLSLKGASVASAEFTKMQLNELESRIHFHVGVRESVARSLREAQNC